jgi:hypothetical protein
LWVKPAAVANDSARGLIFFSSAAVNHVRLRTDIIASDQSFVLRDDLRGQVDAQAIRQQAYAEFQAELQQQHAQQQTTYIAKFAADKPYFSHIQNEVLYHVLALKGTNPELDYRELLRRAHDKALAEHPDLDPKTKERTQTQMREAKRKADEARRQQSLNVRSTVGAAPRSSGDMYSRMADIYDQIHGRH